MFGAYYIEILLCWSMTCWYEFFILQKMIHCTMRWSKIIRMAMTMQHLCHTNHATLMFQADVYRHLFQIRETPLISYEERHCLEYLFRFQAKFHTSSRVVLLT